jgi:AhpD family alkylhydroperoxidase
LKEVWTDVKNVMTKETLIDKKTKEMIYMAVSITNNCSYCTHSHTASAKKLGMSDEEHSEFLRIVALAAKTNQLVNGLQVPVDEIFDADK